MEAWAIKLRVAEETRDLGLATLLRKVASSVSDVQQWEFPGGPGVRTPHFHCRGHGFSPRCGN